MSEIYRKRGRVTRYENGWIVNVAESGVAIEEGSRFECRPEGDPLESSAMPDLREIAARIESLGVERIVLTVGEAEHELGDRRWRERTERLHVSIARNQRRILIDLGTFDVDAIVNLSAAFARAEERESAPPSRLRLAPSVAAALVPALIGVPMPNLELRQTAGGVDGKGRDVEDCALVAGAPWPNWYRPSYRVRPVRAPLDVRAVCAATEVDPSLPRAIALLAPVRGPLLRVLVEDGDRIHPATVLVSRIAAIDTGRRWYPYGAGSFGAEMML